MVSNISQSAYDCLNRNDYAGAEVLCQQMLDAEPNNPGALKLSGTIALNSGNFDRAIHAFSKIISLGYKNAAVHYNLGLAYLNAEDATSAVQNFNISIEIQPDLACVYGDLCLALNRCDDVEAAISAGEKAVLLLPDSPVAHFNLAQVYDLRKDFDSAYKHYQIAAELFPNHHGIQMGLAVAHLGFGNLDKAVDCYRKVIELYPKDVESYHQLVQINKFTTPDHEDVNKLKTLLTESWLNDEDRASVLSSLGKIYQDCKLYDDAFSYFKQANHLQELRNKFEFELFEKYITNLIGVTGSEFFSDKNKQGDNSEVPVFIVGMPRSGTSLVEKILSSHHDVFGAGELTWLGSEISSMHVNLNTAMHYPECLSILSESNITVLADEYLQHIQMLSDNESRVVDKMPNNFIHIGLIHVLFPNAKIIHCRRDPRDTCVSMFTLRFPEGGVPFSTNLLKLGAYYAQYQRLMAHWHKVLPAGTILDVDYEKIVSNQEAESRRLVAFTGIEWDDNCLTFYQKQGRVDTASNMQVIKPIYSSSIGRWKKYEKHLELLEQGFRYWD